MDNAVLGASPMEQESETARLRDELAHARRRIDDLLVAQQANERELRERERMIDLDRGRAAGLVLDAIDELDRCLKSGERSPLSVGVRLIRNELQKKLEADGVKRVVLEGTLFDPTVAEAADVVAVAVPSDNGRVVGEIRGAYTRGGKLIRSGRVRVGRYVMPRPWA